MNSNKLQIDLPDEAGIKFRHCLGFPGYCVGDDGSVWSCRYAGGAWRRLKPRPTKKGRLRVDIAGRWIQVHRLILEAFIGPCPFGMQGLHWDDDASNNRLSNLRWDTPKQNKVDAKRNGRLTFAVGERHGGAKLDCEKVKSIRAMVADGETQASVARLFGVTISAVHLIVHRKKWRHVQ